MSEPHSNAAVGAAPPLATRTRLLYLAAAWTGMFLAQPGVLRPDGFATLAALSVAPWGWACARPGRRAFLIEFVAALLGYTAICFWINYVWFGALLCVGVAPALWMACAGVLLRRLAVRLPLAIAVPLAWIFGDTLRHAIPPPFSFGWMRLGIHAHHVEGLVGAARVVGVEGLGFVLAAVGGMVAALLAGPFADRSRLRAIGIGLSPLGLALVLAAATGPPPVEPGPRLLLVQPAFPQSRKQYGDPRELYADSLARTEQGLARESAAGRPAPDLVCWGEAVFPYPLLEDGLVERVASGELVPPPWWERVSERDGRPLWDEDHLRGLAEFEEAGVGYALFGSLAGTRPKLPDVEALLPAGTSFLSGAELIVGRDGELRRSNAIALWGPDGERRGVAGKRRLVPGGETMAGLERWQWVRTVAEAVAGYIPELAAFERTGVLPLRGNPHARQGERGADWRIAATVCFDNLYDFSYSDALNAERVDLLLVCSNEAWFRESWELDQMVAFSRLIAVMTGRSFARATNSGVSVLIDPAGREVERLRDEQGRDRMVPGALAVTVPVPVRPGEPDDGEPGDGEPGSGESRTGPDPLRTPWVRFARPSKGLWLALPLLLGLLPRRRGNRSRDSG